MRILLLCLALLVFSAVACRAEGEDPVPRTIIALYDDRGGDLQSSYIHLMVEMPLNHLGLNVEYHEIHEPLPDITRRRDVRGVLTWFFSDTHMDAESYLKWALNAVESGKKYVVMGALGIAESKQRYGASVAANRFLSKIGIQIQEQWVDQPFDVTFAYKTPEMFPVTSSAVRWRVPPYEKVQAIGDKTLVHLAAESADHSRDSVLVVTSPGGGYIADGYIFRANERNGDEVGQWLVNPFTFFRTAYATDGLPKPDTTTIAGRRIYYSNIDGDGWNNLTQLEEYRGTKTLSAQVIMDKAIKPYPDLPVLLALIAADIDPAWAAVEKSRSIAKEFLALPQVEAGSHTYSHPFHWQFFKDGNWQREIPYLPLYPNPTWKPKEGSVEKKSGKIPPPMPIGYSVPRGYAHEPFDIHKEVEGSIQEISQLLPKGKQVEVLAWSGNCSPWEEAVRLTREAKVENINGGDTRFDPEYPSYASVAAIGRQVGKERQVYVSMSNENTYTNLWSENFHAHEYLRKTLKNTETPIRLKPFNVYYHIYAGEKEASLRALLKNLDYARMQNIAPVTVRHYGRIAEGFYTTRFIPLGDERWRIEERGALQTLRWDRATFKTVDFERSSGVVGQRHFQGSLYVYLDAAVTQPVVALKEAKHVHAPERESRPYLVESRWLVTNIKHDKGGLAFTAQGYGNGDMVWQVPRAGRYRVRLGDKEITTVTAKDDRLLRLALPADAIKPQEVRVEEVGAS